MWPRSKVKNVYPRRGSDHLCQMLFLGPSKVKTESMVRFNNVEVISLDKSTSSGAVRQKPNWIVLREKGRTGN